MIRSADSIADAAGATTGEGEVSTGEVTRVIRVQQVATHSESIYRHRRGKPQIRAIISEKNSSPVW
jgi:hypothetical protein